MSDDPEKPARPALDRETMRDLTAPEPAAAAAPVTALHGCAERVRPNFTRFLPGPDQMFTTFLTGPGGVGAHPGVTTILDAEGKPKPGSYKVETTVVTEFDVLESGELVVKRSEIIGGTPG